MASIHPIPAASVQSLTATQILTTPPSLIKELVENSIDAHSTHISVEVSANLLDLILVRDNGDGILPGEDRVVLARRSWTSKIRRWEEVERGIVGTLGFRGEALAAAADMAGGGLEIVTRTEGERVAWEGRFDRAGELVREANKSAPVGTTVRVVDFLKNLPVRRETAIKSSQKYLQHVKKTLVTYALSHPNIRFSLKVLPSPGKTKQTPAGESNWVYSPSKAVPEAVMKIFGKDLVNSCIWVESKESRVGIEAFLIKPGTDPSQFPKQKQGAHTFPPSGHYIYVDCRPMSCLRSGPFKSLLGLYKNYIRSSLLSSNPGSSTAPANLTEPFLFLNMRSKIPGLYDPNIEPAKDDVLFNNWEKDVLKVVDELFENVYGKRTVGKGREATTGEREGRKQVRNSGGDVDFSVLLARKPEKVTEVVEKEDEDMINPEDPNIPVDGVEVVSDETPSHGAEPAAPQGNTDEGEIIESRISRKRNPTWGYTMSTTLVDDDEDEHLPPPTTSKSSQKSKQLQLEEEEEALAARRDINLSNPWVAAKMNAPANSSSPHRPIGGNTIGSGIGSGNGSGSGNTPVHKSPQMQAVNTPPTVGRSTGPYGPGGPGYKIYSSSRNTAKLNNNNSSSPFGGGSSSRPPNGGLDRWFASGSMNTNTSPTRAIGNRSGIDVEEPPILNRPAPHLEPNHPPEPQRGFMSANNYYIEKIGGGGGDMHPPPPNTVNAPYLKPHITSNNNPRQQPHHPSPTISDEYTEILTTRPINSTPTSSARFNGVDGPGGVFIRSNTAREILRRLPKRHDDSDSNDDDEGEGEAEHDRSPESLRSVSPSSPTLKRRKVTSSKGKEKEKQGRVKPNVYPDNGNPVSSTYVSDMDIDNDEAEEQGNLNTPHAPPPKKPRLHILPKKFVPPLLPRPIAPPPGAGNTSSSGDDDLQPQPQQTRTSPHKNRQRTATAALGMAIDTVINTLSSSQRKSAHHQGPQPHPAPGAISTLLESDQDEEHEHEQEHIQVTKPRARTHTRTKSTRRHLPLETVPIAERIHNITIRVTFPEAQPVAPIAILHHGLMQRNAGYFSRGKEEWSVTPLSEMEGIDRILTGWVERAVADRSRDGGGGGGGGEWERELIGRVREGGWDVNGGEGDEGEDGDVGSTNAYGELKIPVIRARI
ncbi:hypothetical protein DFH27DRAFT_657266 [Peziza echinospora]|nr:hypothetical protein DFH27DRAFT_657266 [Peziza echinospora]